MTVPSKRGQPPDPSTKGYSMLRCPISASQFANAPGDETGAGYLETVSARWCPRSGDTEAIPAVS
ncbi:MAG TPA: hypothetical protein DDZ51_07025 [Planctomycetaceae bacterium]|nr:hypothetical protein [Planctomycetaceae bacterium]